MIHRKKSHKDVIADNFLAPDLYSSINASATMRWNSLKSPFLLMIALSSAHTHLFAQDFSEGLAGKKAITYSGGIDVRGIGYSVSGIAPRRNPLSYLISGNAAITIKGLSLPFSFQFSEQQRDFRQPFNQFGISPSYKWVRVHLGYRNLSYSRYTLDGHQFLGAGFDLTPGKLRISAMWGRFLKAVQEDTSKQLQQYNNSYPYAAYDRFGYAVKIGFGSPKNYFDLSFLKAKDRVGSVAVSPQEQYVQPGENACLGLRTHLSFLKRFTFDVDAGISAYTRDVRAELVPVGESGLGGFAKSILQPRISTSAYYAGDATLAYKDKLFGLAIKYGYLLPDYKSMGMYYMQTDVERITLIPSFNNKRRTLQLQASIGKEHDNLEKKKLSQTDRIVGSFNCNISPKPNYGLSITYANYGITQKAGTKSLSDTTRLDQVTHSIVATPRYTLQRPDAIHSFVYLFCDQTLNDNNKFNSQQFNMTTINNTLSYNLYLNKSGVGINASLYTVNTKLAVGNTSSAGGTLGLSKAFLKNALSSAAALNYSANTFNGQQDGSTLQLNTNHVFAVSRKSRFKADALFTLNESKSGAVNRSFREFLLTIGYSYLF